VRPSIFPRLGPATSQAAERINRARRSQPKIAIPVRTVVREKFRIQPAGIRVSTDQTYSKICSREGIEKGPSAARYLSFPAAVLIHRLAEVPREMHEKAEKRRHRGAEPEDFQGPTIIDDSEKPIRLKVT
jgi:hypothetical protein